jgi:hypothetical protein
LTTRSPSAFISRWAPGRWGSSLVAQYFASGARRRFSHVRAMISPDSPNFFSPCGRAHLKRWCLRSRLAVRRVPGWYQTAVGAGPGRWFQARSPQAACRCAPRSVRPAGSSVLPSAPAPSSHVPGARAYVGQHRAGRPFTWVRGPSSQDCQCELPVQHER